MRGNKITIVLDIGDELFGVNKLGVITRKKISRIVILPKSIDERNTLTSDDIKYTIEYKDDSLNTICTEAYFLNMVVYNGFLWFDNEAKCKDIKDKIKAGTFNFKSFEKVLLK